MPKKRWYELEMVDELSARAVKCPECKGTGKTVVDERYKFECQNCMGYGRVNEYDWNVVAKIKSKGLAELTLKLLKAYYGNRIRMKK